MRTGHWSYRRESVKNITWTRGLDYAMLAGVVHWNALYQSALYQTEDAVPYRSGSEKRNKVQFGTGSPIWGGTPPTPIPERVLDGIPGFIAWLSLLFCIASAVAFPRTLLLIAALVGFYSTIRFLIAGVANFIGLRQIRQWEVTDWKARYGAETDEHALPWDVVRHVVIIPNYKEPLHVLQRTLEALGHQYEAGKRLIVVLAMEAGEPNCVEKAEALVRDYGDRFAHLFYTVHPRGLPGEMQCKSANESWAARWIRRRLIDEMGYRLEHLCVTTMDADTQWHPTFFYALTYHFAIDKERHERFWQAPIRYHGNVWRINPLSRIVNAYAGALELAYLAATWWRAMPMSSYSLSFKLLEKSGYWDGDVISDEWHMFIKAYFAREGRVKIVPIMLPFIADATVGTSLLNELQERYQQTLRHAWGSKEVGYMIAKMIDHPELPFWSSFRLLTRIAHDILLAGAGWIILTVGSQLPILLHPEIAPLQLGNLLENPQAELQSFLTIIVQEPTWLLLIGSGTMVVLLGAVFWYQDVTVRPPREHRMTWGERFWSVVSFPLLPVLTLFVVALPTIQAQTLLLLGIPLQFRVTKKV